MPNSRSIATTSNQLDYEEDETNIEKVLTILNNFMNKDKF